MKALVSRIGFLWMFAGLLIFTGCSGNSNSNSANNTQNPQSPAATTPASSAASSPASSTPATPQTPAVIVIPAGTEIHAVLDAAISSRTNQAGDTFAATLTRPLTVRGETIVPSQARVGGVVVDARPSGRLSKPALLSLTLKTIDVNGSRIDIRTDDLTIEGKSHKKRDVVAVGGGSALGAIIGGIAGGGKGAAIGALAGGGAGTAGAAATGKKDITLPAESQVTFRLSRSVSVQMH